MTMALLRIRCALQVASVNGNRLVWTLSWGKHNHVQLSVQHMPCATPTPELTLSYLLMACTHLHRPSAAGLARFAFSGVKPSSVMYVDLILAMILRTETSQAPVDHTF
jgi:hypothetical protein